MRTYFIREIVSSFARIAGKQLGTHVRKFLQMWICDMLTPAWIQKWDV